MMIPIDRIKIQGGLQLAFEDDLGYDQSQPIGHNYALSASELVTRTFTVWVRNLLQYIIIVGILSATFIGVSFVLLLVLFDILGTLGTDPLSFLISLILDPLSNPPLIALSLGFAIVTFVINAIVIGAAIKFTLDEYGENRGAIGTSFSHSFGRTPIIIIVQLILTSFAAILFTPATILIFRAMDMIDISDPFNPIIQPGSLELLMSAFGLLVVGGVVLIYINIRFAPTLAIVIDTDLSAIDSLKRSWELTSGNFFHVFGGLILLILATSVLGIVVSAVLTFTFLPEPYRLILESLISSIFFSALTYIFAVVLYRDLESRKGISDFPDYVL